MTKDDFVSTVEHYVPMKWNRECVLSAAWDYSEALIAAKPHVSCCKEILQAKLKEAEMLTSWNVEGSDKLDERLRQSDALKIVLKMLDE